MVGRGTGTAWGPRAAEAETETETKRARARRRGGGRRAAGVRVTARGARVAEAATRWGEGIGDVVDASYADRTSGKSDERGSSASGATRARGSARVRAEKTTRRWVGRVRGRGGVCTGGEGRRVQVTRDQFHGCRWISRSFDVVASLARC